jgi:hypothetical protein
MIFIRVYIKSLKFDFFFGSLTLMNQYKAIEKIMVSKIQIKFNIDDGLIL